MKDYSEHLLECAALLAHASDQAMKRRYWNAAWIALKVAREALRMSAALRRLHEQTRGIELEQASFRMVQLP